MEKGAWFLQLQIRQAKELERRAERASGSRQWPQVTRSAAARPVRHPEGQLCPSLLWFPHFKNEDYKRPAS